MPSISTVMVLGRLYTTRLIGAPHDQGLSPGHYLPWCSTGDRQCDENDPVPIRRPPLATVEVLPEAAQSDPTGATTRLKTCRALAGCRWWP
jgi:hypothetical protein